MPRPAPGDSSRSGGKPGPSRRGWGSVARKGADQVGNEQSPRPSQAESDRREHPPARLDRWAPRSVDDDGRPQRKQARVRQRKSSVVSPGAVLEIEERAAKNAPKLVASLEKATNAYEAERYRDAMSSLKPLLKAVPDAPSVLELHGLILYRMGKWSAAAKELEAAHEATMEYHLFPAIMDARRALHQRERVDQLWEELREASPGGEIVAEGRIVKASMMAENNEIAAAIRLLEKAPQPKKGQTPKEHHLRSWYVLGDLYERTGDMGRARDMFVQVARRDPELADVLDRIDNLS